MLVLSGYQGRQGVQTSPFALYLEVPTQPLLLALPAFGTQLLEQGQGLSAPSDDPQKAGNASGIDFH